MEFKTVKDDDISEKILTAKFRAFYAAPGITDTLAGALIKARENNPHTKVRVILDGSANALRLGYGVTEPMPMLLEKNIDVRIEPGLRLNFLVVDNEAMIFTLPAMLVEDPNQPRGPNALVLPQSQIDTLLMTVAPDFVQTTATQSAPVSTPPAIGKEPLTNKHVETVKKEFEKNPPQKFDLARTLNVFNAYVEFIELNLTGLKMNCHTVELPQDIILALGDEETVKRLRTSFKLLDENSTVSKKTEEIEEKVKKLRKRFIRPLGKIGAITLRSKRNDVDSMIQEIQNDIDKFRLTVVASLQKDIDKSRNKLVEGLIPAMKKKPPQELLDQVTGKVTIEDIRHYLMHRLEEVFPTADTVVHDMKLECTRKGVTYETLATVDFQEKVAKAFPMKNWEKPFTEFTAAKADQIPLFGAS